MTDDRLRVGLIGAGKHGRRYAKHVRDDFPDVELVGLARRDEARAAQSAREFACRAFTDYQKLIEVPGLDAVIVVVPPALHVEVVSRALRAGLAVLLEKPAAISVSGGKMLLDLSRRLAVPVMVAHTLRYNSVVRALVANLSAIGPVHSLVLSQRFEPSQLPWIDDPALCGGGIILHTGVHSFDLVRVLTGLETDQVSCQMSAVRTQRTEDNFAATIRLGGGKAFATVSGSRAAGGRTGYIEVAGPGGTLVGDHVSGWVHLVTGVEIRRMPLEPPVPTVREVLRSFTAALRERASMPIPLEEGLRAVAIAAACYESARSGRAEPVDRVAD